MAKQTSGGTPQAGAAKKKKKIQVDVTGKVFIKATFYNVIVTITDVYGNVISWSSAGRNGFKGSRKNTPFAGFELQGRVRHTFVGGRVVHDATAVT